MCSFFESLRYSCLPVVAIILCSCTQPRYNLDFEYSDAQNNPVAWDFSTLDSSGYYYSIDPINHTSGRQSLLIQKSPDTIMNGIGLMEQKIAFAFEGKQIMLTGYLKSENIKNGWGGLWMQVDGETKVSVAFDDMKEKPVTGTTAWTEYKIVLPLTGFGDAGEASEISFGALLNGEGKLWVDNLALLIDGVPINKLASNNLIKPAEPSIEEVKLLQDNSIILDPDLTRIDYTDLLPLKTILGGKRLVGLGEATHGTSDFFLLKTRLLKFLAEEMDFRIIGLEAGMTDTYHINDYVLNGQGDPNELIKKIYYFWNTHELLSLIHWVRHYNTSHEKKIQFVGFDMLTPQSSLTMLKEYYDSQPLQGTHSIIDTLLAGFQNIYRITGNDRKASAASLESMANQLYDTLRMQASENYIQLQARLVGQFFGRIKSGEAHFRDSCMAENITWILEQNTTHSKMMVWMHNFHVGKKEHERTGYFLNKKYSDGYYGIGLSTFEGTYSAIKNGEFIQGNELIPGQAGSLEYYFSKASEDHFFVDLVQTRNSAGFQTLNSKMKIRFLGGAVSERQFLSAYPNKEYDGFIFLRRTKSSQILPGN